MLLPGTHRFKLAGGHPVLDFVNTQGGHRLTDPREDLATPEDLVSWGLQSGWLDQERAHPMLVEIQVRPAEARASLARVRSFREALFRVFLAASEDSQPAPEPLETFEREVRRAWADRRLVRIPEHGYRWVSPESARLDAFIPGLALAASDLLTGPERRRLRLCEATALDGCGWMFLDTSKNGTRRWCEMATCGNKYKARRHYARVRAGRSKPAE
ncbi:MAG TPA: ABATE domain-containing protein [Myxococcaceae bacterium]|nr:ABATE domain-containing protein [Myxococcaceae bacterium]